MNVIPYISVGTLYFGWTPEEVVRTIGEPVARSRNFLREVKLIYFGFNVDFSNEGMAEVTLSPSEFVTINDQYVQNDRAGIELLISQSSNNFIGRGSAIFLDIGVAIAPELQMPFPMTVFARGRMDSLLSSCNKLQSE